MNEYAGYEARQGGSTSGTRILSTPIVHNKQQIGWVRYIHSTKSWEFQSGIKKPDSVHQWERCYIFGD